MSEVGTAFSFFGQAYKLQGGILVLPIKVKKSIPNGMLKKMYEYVYRTGNQPPSINVSTKSELVNKIESWGLTKKQEVRLIETIILFKEKYHLPFSPDVWSLLPDDEKEKIISLKTRAGGRPSRRAIFIEITVSNKDEIKQIAQKYAVGRNSKTIEKYLEQKLKKSINGQVTFSLGSILPPFIRKMLGKYDLKGGPNCFNSGLCVNNGNQFEKEFLNGYELRKSIKREYDWVSVKEERMTGDLLLYSNRDDFWERPVHVATYINEDVVFTKNGVNKFSPYIFQLKTDMEDVYFKKGHYRLQVYRKKPKYILEKAKDCSTLWNKLVSISLKFLPKS